MSVKLDISQSEVYAYQTIHYLVIQQGYQILRIENHQEDIWLIHPSEYLYPIICISTLYQGSKEEQSRLYGIYRMLVKRLSKDGKLLIFTTNECNKEQNERFCCVTIGPNQTYPLLEDRFQELTKVIHDVLNPLEEVAQLSLSLEEVQSQRMGKFKKLLKKHRYPYVTLSMICICMLLYSIFQFLCHYSDESHIWMTMLGGGYPPLLEHAYEYFRFITASFLHSQILPLIINLLIFYSLGKRLERLYGSKIFLLLTVFVMISGNILCYCYQDGIFYGLQYTLWGLFGAYLWSFISQKLYRHHLVRMYAIRIFAFLLLTLLVQDINYLALIASFSMGMLYAFYKEAKQKLYPLLCITSMMVMFVISMVNVPHRFHDTILEKQLLEKYHDTWIQPYQHYLQQQLKD